MKSILSKLKVLAFGLVLGGMIGLGQIATVEIGNKIAEVQQQTQPKLSAFDRFSARVLEFEKERYASYGVQSAQAGVLTDYAENKIVDWLLRGQTFTPPATSYIALFTDTCTDAGPGTEVSTTSTGYSRQAVTASLANWAGTQSAGSTVASSGTSGTTSNNNPVAWSVSTAPWGTVQSVGLMDASTSGNRLICINLVSSISVSAAGFTISFASGQLSVQLDN